MMLIQFCIQTDNDFGWKTKVGLVDRVKQTIGYDKEYGVEETFTHL